MVDEPIERVARMIKNHQEGVINAATTDVTNAGAEARHGCAGRSVQMPVVKPAE